MKTAEELIQALVDTNTPHYIGQLVTGSKVVFGKFEPELRENVLFVGGLTTEYFRSGTLDDVETITGVPREHIEFSYDQMQPFIREAHLPENFLQILKAYQQFDPEERNLGWTTTPYQKSIIFHKNTISKLKPICP
jgi:hypothetical protein